MAESDPGESARAHEPQDAVGDARRPNKPPRLSSWRRRKLARERASAAAVDANADPTPKEGEEEGVGEEEEEDSFVPETPDFDVVASSPGDLANDAAWARLGAAANASSSDSVAMAWDRLGALAATGKDDDDEIATPPRLKKSGKRRRAVPRPSPRPLRRRERPRVSVHRVAGVSGVTRYGRWLNVPAKSSLTPPGSCTSPATRGRRACPGDTR